MVVRVGRALYGGLFEAEPGPALPMVLPGEEVEVSEEELSVLRPSAARIEPACVHFGVCGGCQYQHAAYLEQLRLKREILSTLLTPLSVTGVCAGEPWGYRNRIRLRVRQAPDGSFQAGYNRRGTNEFLPVRMCPIAAPLLWRAASAILDLAAAQPVVAAWIAAAEEIELFTTPDEGSLQVQVLVGQPPSIPFSTSFAAACESLKKAVPELAGAGAVMHPDAPRRQRLGWAGVAWGSDGLTYPVGMHRFWAGRAAFFQVNRFLLEELLREVTAGYKGALSWDLFAGVGLFTRALVKSFDRVVSVEANPVAVAVLEQMARKAPCIEPRGESALAFLEHAVLQRERPDLVVLDPPRAGLGERGAALLARIAPVRIVYVSCDPVTLARDLAVLLAAGYTAGPVTLFDLFPQTFHLETVVALARREQP